MRMSVACDVWLLRGVTMWQKRNSHDADPYDLLYVVGAFDTICKACQQQYCSAGVWTGEEFDKVSWRGRGTACLFALQWNFTAVVPTLPLHDNRLHIFFGVNLVGLMLDTSLLRTLHIVCPRRWGIYFCCCCCCWRL